MGTNFREIRIKIQNFSFTKMRMEISSAKWQPFCPGGEELILQSTSYPHYGFKIYFEIILYYTNIAYTPTHPFFCFNLWSWSEPSDYHQPHISILSTSLFFSMFKYTKYDKSKWLYIQKVLQRTWKLQWHVCAHNIFKIKNRFACYGYIILNIIINMYHDHKRIPYMLYDISFLCLRYPPSRACDTSARVSTCSTCTFGR